MTEDYGDHLLSAIINVELVFTCSIVDIDQTALRLSKSGQAQLASPRKQAQLSIENELQIRVELPDKWERYSDFLFYPSSAFLDQQWAANISEEDKHRVFHIIADTFKVNRIARKSIIPPDDVLRRPDKLYWLFIRTSPNDNNDPEIIKSNDETYWTSVKQNDIVYVWTPEHTMFCPGNITEKTRIVRGNLPQFESASEEIVLDLYAGVGYFTFAYLKSGHVKTVIACEWNEWSVEGLERGAKQNNLPYRKIDPDSLDNERDAASELELLICPGNNESFVRLYENRCDRVNLGLIPSSRQGWPLAVRALKPSQIGWLHVHMNVRDGCQDEFETEMLSELRQLFISLKNALYECQVRHRERVKSFSPKVWHYVFDVECRPL